jgi:hypothetical protein
VIVGVQATAARMSQEMVAAKDMIARFPEWQGRDPESVVADATYGNGEFLQWLMERGITPYMRTRDSALRKNSPLSTVPSGSPFFLKATAIAVRQASNSITADTMLGTVPMSTSGRANVVVRVHKKPNAPVHP